MVSVLQTQHLVLGMKILRLSLLLHVVPLVKSTNAVHLAVSVSVPDEATAETKRRGNENVL